MCAIAGILGLATEDSVAEKMLETMHRRGPDERGVYKEADCCLLHSRLTIIDPQRGHQPMHLKWGRETYTLIYNGELYNTQELRQLLSRLGHRFEGHSDTEVVLRAYAQWEEGCLDRLNGIFSFAVWHHKGRKLFLARDRMGVKPLFYAQISDGFIFASEIKTILAHPEIRPRLDANGAMELVMLGPGRLPGSGVFRGIDELEPGCFGYWRKGKWNWKRYWRLIDREHKENFEDTAQHVRYLVEDAVCRQMVSDVPLGTFLSGGLDSSLISSICAEKFRGEGKVLPTFSVDYQNNDKYFKGGKFQPESDAAYIELMKNVLQTKHNTTVIDPDTLAQALDEAVVARDIPGMADVDASLLLFCKEIRKHVKVALSGECADEIFGGYPWYRDPEIRNQAGFPWSQNTSLRAQFLSPDISNRENAENFVKDIYADSIARCDILPGTDNTERRMKEMVNLNHRWFMQTLLDRKDRMSMYSGLEVRVPFCDYRIAEYLYGVPWEMKDYKHREKGLLRYAMEGFLPVEVLYRKKSPYPKTYDPGYMTIVSRRLKEILKCKNAPIFAIIQKTALEKLLNQEHTWPWYGQLMKGPQTIAFMLQLNRWMELYKVELV